MGIHLNNSLYNIYRSLCVILIVWSTGQPVQNAPLTGEEDDSNFFYLALRLGIGYYPHRMLPWSFVECFLGGEAAKIVRGMKVLGAIIRAFSFGRFMAFKFK